MDQESTQDDALDATSKSSDTDANEQAVHHYVVGVGASAGGLEALEKMFAAMPEDTGMSFVIVQHLSPDFKSHMDKLLGRVTNLPIHVVSNGERVEPDTIYLIPPKKEMVISNGCLLLTDRSSEKVLSHPIDQFFRALAQDVGQYAVGVILSGTGSDGSRGVIDIREHGGLAIVQDPSTCRFDAMPVNARETGKVQLVLPPESMGVQLRQFALDGKVCSEPVDDDVSPIEEEGLARIFQLLRQMHKIDFGHYKPGTVGRRVQRRMDVKKCNTLDEYVDLLATDASEVDELYKDLLIGVTKFFRDGDAFKVLEEQIIPQLIEASGDSVIRVWCCACATGEEAYSVAILFFEALQRMGSRAEFKIFATDADKGALHFAATGIYPDSAMRDVSQQRRDNFFIERADGWVVKNDMRRAIVFAPHNVISDPPFTQMDLVVCRNMLIYLQSPAQRKTLSLFHFALKLNGVLFLGPSETVGDIGDEFDSIDPHWKIYRKRRDVRLPIDLRMPIQSTGLMIPQANVPTPQRLPRGQRELMPALYDHLLSQFMPPSIVIDEDFEILHVFPGAEAFLGFSAGRPSTNLLTVIKPSLKATLAGALRHAQRDRTRVLYSGITHPDPAIDQRLELVVAPQTVSATQTTCLLVQFNLVASRPTQTDAVSVNEVDVSEVNQERIDSLERDLDFSRQNLQATIEELETSNEELQAANEEMVAANEELQSTNEELHSVNEELYTVNAEHQRRVTELDEANADMNNLLATTQVGVVFLDSRFYIRRFTPVIGGLLYIEKQDIGRSIEGFLRRIEDPEFMTRLTEVRENREEREWQVSIQGNAYLVRALPYWTENGILGVVVALVNVQPLKKAQAQLERFKYMCDAAFDGQLLATSDAQIAYCNKSLCESLGYTAAEMSEMSVLHFDIDTSPSRFREKLQLAKHNGGALYESTFRCKDGTTFPVEVSLSHVRLAGEVYGYVHVRDITQRREQDATRRMLEGAVASVSNGIVITDPNQPDNPIVFVNHGFLALTGYSEQEVLGRNCRFMQGEESSPDAVDVIRSGIANGRSCKSLIVNYRKDGTPFCNDLYITPIFDAQGKIRNFVGVQNDVTERIQSSEAAEKSEKTIRLLLNSTAEGIFGIDKSGLCTFCNASAAKMLGFERPDDLVSQSMHALIHHHHADGSEFPIEACPIYHCLETGDKFTETGDVFWRRDGQSFPVQYWSHPIRTGDRIIGVVVTFVDITERLANEQELRKARDQADLANQTKSRFLANMSHELRTPMAAIMGFTEILQQETEDEEVLSRLDTIRRNGDYLLRLLNDVLDLSRVEAGKLKVTKSETPLQELIEHVFELMTVRTTEYKNTLNLIYQGDLPVTISTDEARFRQVLINLIANALKFSPGGEVDVRIQMCDARTLEIEVADNGIGMDENQQLCLFQPFSQASDEISERFGGTGLGLNITQRLIEALDGEISVQSRVGDGSTFTVRIPVEPIGELKPFLLMESAACGSEEPAAADLKQNSTDLTDLNARVLIADDMRDIRYIAEHMLSKAGCRVQIAENGRQAVDTILKAIDDGNPFDLVLMDMQMPILSGDGAVRELRERGVEVPIIALTADAMKGTRRRVLQMGFDEYMAKPLNARKLLQIASTLLLPRE